MVKFIVGNTYRMNSICDHNCVWAAIVLKRTAQFVTLKIAGDRYPVRCKVRVYENMEECAPLGRYSMSPLLRARII